ncbi:hypothetical protein FOZ61_009862 [Perkinsus olseni]|uniref:N-acetyltransferase domain-containing protein n=1 Tax=Perkinsus olseni TaxID=32597 RepID=A0A7J6L0K5_PEROL|nr:hypothetical protein FOZ61_009862 [Perkinsus olseni]KAF4658103.1 hypothetical protein FOL46_007119 [Perkinsus olseni]
MVTPILVIASLVNVAEASSNRRLPSLSLSSLSEDAFESDREGSSSSTSHTFDKAQPARPGDEECGVPYKLPTIGRERRFVAAIEPSLPFLPREVIGLVEMRVPYEEPRYGEVISIIKSGMSDTRPNTTQVCHIAQFSVDESWKDDGVREKLLEEALADLWRERPGVAAAFTVENSDDVDAMMLYGVADFARLESARGKVPEGSVVYVYYF